MNGERTTDNFHRDCPARMADGRIFTDYRPTRFVNQYARVKNEAKNNFEYRYFLVNNAKDLMRINNEYIKWKSGCGKQK